MPELSAFRVVAILCVRAPNGVIISTGIKLIRNEEALAHDRGFKVSSGFRIAPNGSNQAPRGTNDFPYALAVSGNKRAMRVLPR